MGSQEFPAILGTCLAAHEDPSEALTEAFRRMDTALWSPKLPVASMRTIGSAAPPLSYWLREAGCRRILCANCGDSRAVLCRGGLAVDLSGDHKPNDPQERSRIEAAGGAVVMWGP